LTLFALVLVIGLLVDDAIVVVENVERIMHEERLAPRDATLKSMSEITGALIGIKSKPPANGRYEIVVGLFTDEITARDYVATLRKRGLMSAQWEQPKSSGPREVLEIQAKDVMFAEQLKTWIAPFPSAVVMSCVR